MIDSFGDGWNGASWTLKETGSEAVVAGPYTFSSGASATEMVTAWTVAALSRRQNGGAIWILDGVLKIYDSTFYDSNAAVNVSNSKALF
jgi:hypothetical protein